MTHTLHRVSRPGEADGDWVVLAMTALGVNRKGGGAALRRFLELALTLRPVGVGDMRQGNGAVLGAPALLAGVGDDAIVHAVFTERAAVGDLLRLVEREGLGVSVVVSGDLRATRACCSRAGVRPHTVALSLGTWGRTDLLPPRPVLELVSMCGHGMVTSAMASSALAEAGEAERDVDALAAKLAAPCVCGVFNAARAARLLERSALGPRRRRAAP